jgi:hypothetical protein
MADEAGVARIFPGVAPFALVHFHGGFGVSGEAVHVSGGQIIRIFHVKMALSAFEVFVSKVGKVYVIRLLLVYFPRNLLVLFNIFMD